MAALPSSIPSEWLTVVQIGCWPWTDPPGLLVRTLPLLPVEHLVGILEPVVLYPEPHLRLAVAPAGMREMVSLLRPLQQAAPVYLPLPLMIETRIWRMATGRKKMQ